MIDETQARTALLLLKSFGPAPVFLLARLLGVPEQEAARVLAGLAHDGLVAEETEDRWFLTDAGVDNLKPTFSERPAAITRWLRGRGAGKSGV
jgi:hypothetical protein